MLSKRESDTLYVCVCVSVLDRSICNNNRISKLSPSMSTRANGRLVYLFFLSFDLLVSLSLSPFFFSLSLFLSSCIVSFLRIAADAQNNRWLLHKNTKERDVRNGCVCFQLREDWARCAIGFKVALYVLLYIDWNIYTYKHTYIHIFIGKCHLTRCLCEIITVRSFLFRFFERIRKSGKNWFLRLTSSKIGNNTLWI